MTFFREKNHLWYFIIFKNYVNPGQTLNLGIWVILWNKYLVYFLYAEMF